MVGGKIIEVDENGLYKITFYIQKICIFILYIICSNFHGYLLFFFSGDIRMVDKVIKKNIKNHNNKKKTKDVQNFQSNNESQVTNLAEFSSSDSNSYLFNEPVENETDAENKVIENNEMQDTSLLNVKKEYVDQMSMDLVKFHHIYYVLL